MTADPEVTSLPEMLTLAETAHVLGVNRSTAGKLVKAGLLSRHGEGHKKVRYSRSEVLALRARREAAAAIGTVRERLLSRLLIRPSGCLEWEGAHDQHGYGRLMVEREDGNGYTPARAHRLMYEMFVGPIPKDYDVDHLCRNTCCSAPAHLEAVTHQVNIQRGYDLKPKKPKCLRGHPRTPDNVRASNGGCKECRREDDRRHREASRPVPIRTPLTEEQQPGIVPGAAA